MRSGRGSSPDGRTFVIGTSTGTASSDLVNATPNEVLSDAGGLVNGLLTGAMLGMTWDQVRFAHRVHAEVRSDADHRALGKRLLPDPPQI